MFRKFSCLLLLGMSFALPGCGSDSDEPINIGNFNTLAQVVFATQPQNVNLGSNLPDLRIEGRDQFGQVISVSQGQVELRLGNNPSGASLLVNGSPTTTVSLPVQNGSVTFSGIGVDRVGTGYTLVATFTAPNTTGSLSATSQAFNVGSSQVSSVVFLRSTQDLWGTTGANADVSTLDSAFGTGNWTLANFETADPSQVFQGTDRLVFMDGGDDGATAFGTFLTANNTTIRNFVQSGGRVILNSAPNVGGNITTPFDATLDYAESTNERNLVAVDSTHPIGVACNGTVQFQGGSFSHALVVAADMTPIITALPEVNARALTAADNVVLAEARVGSGLVLVGGMTTTNFHGPTPNADRLRVNILRYAGGLPLLPAGPPDVATRVLQSSSKD